MSPEESFLDRREVETPIVHRDMKPENVPAGDDESIVRSAVVAALDAEDKARTGEREKDGRERRLHYSQHLHPESCDRALALYVQGTPAEPATIERRRVMERGRTCEAEVIRALDNDGRVAAANGFVTPMRPSAWCWIGRYDVLLKDGLLYEIKSASGHAMACGPRVLVRDTHRWQLSAYFHEVKERGHANRAALLYLDREGSHLPIVVRLEGSLLVPLEQIVAREEQGAALLLATRAGSALPDRAPRRLIASVWKGKPKEGRRVSAERVLPSVCGFCAYQARCAPGPESEPAELTDAQREAVISTAEAEWIGGATGTPRKIDLGTVSGHGW